MPQTPKRPSAGLLEVTPSDRRALGRWASPPGPGTPVSQADVPDFIRGSWRWDNLEALRYEYDRAIAKRDSARRAKAVGEAVGWGGLGASGAERGTRGRLPAAMRGALGRVGGPVVGAAGAGLAWLGDKDEIKFGRQAEALRQRIAMLERR